LTSIIKDKGLEMFACRLHGVLGRIVKRVDLEMYGLFRTIMVKEGNEWEKAVADTSIDDQTTVQDLAKQFFEVRHSLFRR
jgi:hypothetical protein